MTRTKKAKVSTQKRRRLTSEDVRTGENIGFVYLLHFESPYKGKQHYIGYADNPEARLSSHIDGTGARITRAVSQAGIPMTIARVWVGDRFLEADMKVRKINARVWCPICNPEKCDPLHGSHVHETPAIDLVSYVKECS